MVAALSSFLHPFRILAPIPQLLKKPFLFISRAHSPQNRALLANRKIEQFTPSLAYLKGLSTNELNQSWSSYLDRVTKELLAVPGLAKVENDSIRAEMKKVLENLELKNLELFFENIAKNEIEKPSPQAVDEILKVIDLKKIEACLQAKNPYFHGAKVWASELYEKEPRAIEVRKQAVRTSNVVTRFFPNLGHVIIKAFDLFDSERPPATLYEYGVLITMYFHFFCLPYALFKGLSAVIATSANVLLASTLIIGLTVAALYVYLRWIKGCPKQVIYCENLAAKQRERTLHKVVGREEEFQQALACINSQQGTTVHLLIIGEPGVGKTEFMNGLAQRLTDRKIFKFKNWCLFGAPNAFQSPGEKMEEAFRETRGHDVIFMCDELGDAKELSSFLKPVLNNDSIQFIGAMTSEQYENLKKSDKAFEERFKPIFLKSTDKKETIRILNEKIRRCAPHLSYNQEALEKIFDLSQNRGYCQPRKAISILDELINKIHQFKIDDYISPDYRTAEEALQVLKVKGWGFDSPLNRPLSKECVEYLAARSLAQNKLEECEKQMKIQREGAKIVSSMSQRELQVKRELEELRSSLFQKKATTHQIRRYLFSTFFVYPKLAEMVQQMASHVKDFPLRLDVALVEKVVQQDLDHRKAAAAKI